MSSTTRDSSTHLDDGSLRSFGALLIATGADPVRLNIPGGDGPTVHYLRTFADSQALARRLVVHNDLSRGRAGYGFYAVATVPFARGSFIHQDGLLSIRRSYRRAELQAVVPPGWQVRSMFPQRLLLILVADWPPKSPCSTS